LLPRVRLGAVLLLGIGEHYFSEVSLFQLLVLEYAKADTTEMSATKDLTEQEKIWAVHPDMESWSYSSNKGFLRPSSRVYTEYECLLCNIVYPYDPNAKHLSELAHTSKVSKMKKYRSEKCGMWVDCYADYLKIKAQIDVLGLKRWRDEVNSVLVNRMLQEPPYTLGDQNLQEAMDVLKLCMFKERVSCLELAVWKYSCCNYSIEPIRCYLDLVFCYKEAWKRHKKATRGSNCITIIVSCVLPYLRDA
jgi:hypothetical protein